MPQAEPPVTFSTFLVSLASSAMAHLGEVHAAEEAADDVRLARHTLDLLDILEGKTKGNLDADEARLLDALQRELRERYIERTRAKGD
jgi:hypothetical protein